MILNRSPKIYIEVIKLNVIFWGTGNEAKHILNLTLLEEMSNKICILGFVDNDKAKWGKTFCGKTIFSPNQINEMFFDIIIIISTKYYKEIYDMLIYWLHIEPYKIKDKYYLLKLMLIEKYKNTTDKEIIDTLKFLESNELSVFNQYIENGKEINEVYWDNMENMPYIIFEEKKVYFPYDYKFSEIEGKKVLIDFRSEQQQTSPHLYINNEVKIDAGDIVADVGVCEGNFAIQYVEKVSKLYLFECEQRWLRPLEKTFEKFKHKVVLCNRFVGRSNVDKYISLDTIIDGRLDFLKMDIEGAEIEALIGARLTLMNNNVKCSICSYHKMNDEMAISDLLNSYGYRTFHSDGYMCFFYDQDIWQCPEFRRGIVYGVKQK